MRGSRGASRTAVALAAVVAAAGLAVAGGAAATPEVEIVHAAARVTIIPEARSDVSVVVAKANPRLPLKISRVANVVTVDGGLGWRAPNCHSSAGHKSVGVMGLGVIAYDDLPQIVVHTPLNSRISANGAVHGAVGPGGGTEISAAGCGDWTVADQTGPLKLHMAGSGDVRAGSAASADLDVSGSGDIVARDIRAGLTTSIAGSGDISIASASGPLHSHTAGSGDLRVHGGAVTDMEVSVAGSGDVHFGGVAQSLTAHVAGSGDVWVTKVTGPVTKHIAGSGELHVGH